MKGLPEAVALDTQRRGFVSPNLSLCSLVSGGNAAPRHVQVNAGLRLPRVLPPGRPGVVFTQRLFKYISLHKRHLPVFPSLTIFV